MRAGRRDHVVQAGQGRVVEHPGRRLQIQPFFDRVREDARDGQVGGGGGLELGVDGGPGADGGFDGAKGVVPRDGERVARAVDERLAGRADEGERVCTERGGVEAWEGGASRLREAPAPARRRAGGRG